MNNHHVVMKLNQQQLELLDRTIAQGVAVDHANLVRHALREYAAKHRNESVQISTTHTGDTQ